jgi:hypothetical protein
MKMIYATGAALALIVTAQLAGTGQIRAQADCKPHKVTAPLLQVRKDAKTPGVYVTTLQDSDIACISNAPPVGPQKFVFVVHKTVAGGASVKVGGWASSIFMKPVDGRAAAKPATPAKRAAKPAKTAKTAKSAEPAVSDVLRFDQPVPYGAHQVRGKTLKQLIERKPMFPPLEGLPKNLWEKPCSSCHKWNAKLLCDQGKSYLPKAAEVFRHQHPYGGAYKLALMRWAKTGCQ